MTLPARAANFALMIGMAMSMAAAPASGQRKVESRDVSVAQRCSAIVDRIRTGVTTDNAILLHQLRDCDESAGPVFSGLWSTTHGDAAVLDQLVRASANVRDARIVDALTAVVNSVERPVSDRCAALTVLASYFDPFMIGHVQMEQGRIGVQLARLSHVIEPLEGAQPITDAQRTGIVSLVMRLQSEGPRGDLQAMAKMFPLPAR